MIKNNFSNRIMSEQRCASRISNDDLVCKTCVHKFDDSVVYGNTSICMIYEIKPNEIILGGQCKYYEEFD